MNLLRSLAGLQIGCLTLAFGATQLAHAQDQAEASEPAAEEAELKPASRTTYTNHHDPDEHGLYAQHSAEVERTREKEEDDKPRLFWLMPAPGFKSVNLTTFQASDEEDDLTADLVPTVAAGPEISLGMGLRFLVLSLGARGNVAFLSNRGSERPVSNLRLWSIDGELGLHFIPNVRLDPYLMFAGGYSVFSGFEDVPDLGGKFRVAGPNARVGLGLDYFASDTVSIAALLTGELLFLTRPGVSAQDLVTPERVETLGEARARVLEADGTSVGTAVALTVGPAFHFE